MMKVTTPHSPLLRVRNLTVRRAQHTILHKVNMDVAPGEWIGLVGANGAGKTTLLHALSGTVEVLSGQIRFADQAITRLPPQARHRLGLARSFQRSQLFGLLSVYEHFALVRCYPSGRPLSLAQIDAELHRWGLQDQSHLSSTHLSYPDQRLLDLALALAGAPRLLLLDEPCAGLGPEERERMLTHVRQQHAAGCTIIMVEHDLELLNRCASRIVHMDNGEIPAS